MPRKNSQVNIKLKKFNMDNIGNNKVIVFIGRRFTGKSSLVLDYLFYNQDFPAGAVFSPTEKYNSTFSDYVPALFLYDGFDNEVLEKIIEVQQEKSEKFKNDPDYTADPRFFIILDDCLASAKEWVRHEAIKTIFMNGRHLNITFILTMQYVKGIPPDLRTNIDYIFICKEASNENKKKLFAEFGGIFPDFYMFSNALKTSTSNFSSMVIDNTSQSDDISDQVTHYKAALHNKDFRTCNDVFWLDNEKHLKRFRNSKTQKTIKAEEYGPINTNRPTIQTTLLK